MAAIAGRFELIEAVYVGAIAQLVERVVRNDEVGGSNPPGSTLRLRLRVAQPPRSRSRSVSGEARRAKTGGQKEHFHFPVNRGGRFSIKLATPSRKSLPRNATTISRLASMV